jgi:hypothetical protein
MHYRTIRYYASLPDKNEKWGKQHPLLFTYTVPTAHENFVEGEVEHLHRFLIEVSKINGGEELLDNYGFELNLKEAWWGKEKIDEEISF